MDCSTPGFPCPSLSPRVCSNLCPLSPWCHPTISFFVTLFSSCPQSFPASGSFPMSQLFASGGQSIGASASVLPMNIQGWFPLGLTSLISFLSKGLSRVFSNTTVWKHQFFGTQPFYGLTLTSIDVFFSFWPTSLCITVSGFIHLTRTDSNLFLLWLSNIPLYICESHSIVSQLFVTPWTIQSMEFSRPEYWSG